MATSNVPAPTWSPQGFVGQLESAIVTGRMADFQTAFGGRLNPDLTSPQGQLVMSEAAIIGATNDQFLFYTSQVDPAFAQGRMQDGIGRIYFIERNPAQPTTVRCTVIGAQGVTIPFGALAQDASGNIYTCTDGGTFDATGTMTLTFANTAVGPIPCPAGTLTTIYQAIPGWDTITNPEDGVLGRLVEGRMAFESRRRLSVAKNSIGALGAIRGAVLSVPNVIDAFVTENSTNGPLMVGGISLPANCVYVCVAGGASADVARAIWSKKAPGCSYGPGNTTVQVLDTQSGYTPPYPAYSVTYMTAIPLTIQFSVVLANSPLVPADVAVQVQQAIISAFAGTDGGNPARIAGQQFASRYYKPITDLGPWAKIVDIQIGSINSPACSFVGSIAGTVLTIVSITSGSLAVGQTLDDVTGNIAAGTTITALLSGSGGAGSTYSVSLTQNVAQEAMVTVVPNLFTIPVQINQIPVVSASDIVVTLV